MVGLPGDVGVACLSEPQVASVLPGYPLWLRQARHNWAAVLDGYEDHEDFKAWRPQQLEKEYGRVGARLEVESRLERDVKGWGMSADVTRFTAGHLLPRYDLRRTRRLSTAVHPVGSTAAVCSVGVGFVGAAVSLAAGGDPRTHLLCAAGFAGSPRLGVGRAHHR